MNYIVDFFSILSDLGASVMMPIIITIFALVLGSSFGKAVRAGLTVGVGFIGLNMVIGLLGSNLGPAAQQMVENIGLNLNVIDVGWPSAAAIAFGTKVGAFMIPVGLLVNIVMLVTNTTETIDVDIWDYWHFAFTGSLVAIATGSVAWGIYAAVINMVIIMVIADVTAPLFEKYNDLPGISLPHGFSAAFAPIAWVINKLIDMIPGLNKIDIDAKKMENKLGVFGEPLLIGTIIGLIIAILAYGIGAYDKYLSVAITMGASLVLIPKMAAMLMEGLMPVSDAAQEFIQKKFSNREKIYIGLDSAVALGHPVTLSVSLILVPITILLALIVPGNQVIPFADLAVIPFALVFVVPICKGNAFRTLIVGIVIMAMGLLIATSLAPLHTQAAIEAAFDMPEGVTLISSICDGANPIPWLFVKGFELLNNVGSAIVFGVIAIAMAIWNRARILKATKASKEA
ncbi:PTS galactitol transporter subunit IIC [Alkalibaculum sp. M08DMB]|uniref:PTS galactitol transporter subunit IIC n=1 Tax=Alkalibaculum sporogenes TaxID=2655001 RepID=A0A6A7KC39_9FIRM|nr:PTS transporter subunit IIC [Alkalibaculum sporogenes]MPW26994.1 PTS galactitol transporter subunit IIC [Alkalibaculum sporogenes]